MTDARLADGSRIIAAYVRDITERKRTRELLAQRAEQQVAIAELGRMALETEALAELMHTAVATIAQTLGIGRSRSPSSPMTGRRSRCAPWSACPSRSPA